MKFVKSSWPTTRSARAQIWMFGIGRPTHQQTRLQKIEAAGRNTLGRNSGKFEMRPRLPPPIPARAASLPWAKASPRFHSPGIGAGQCHGRAIRDETGIPFEGIVSAFQPAFDHQILLGNIADGGAQDAFAGIADRIEDFCAVGGDGGAEILVALQSLQAYQIEFDRSEFRSQLAPSSALRLFWLDGNSRARHVVEYGAVVDRLLQGEVGVEGAFQTGRDKDAFTA